MHRVHDQPLPRISEQGELGQQVEALHVVVAVLIRKCVMTSWAVDRNIRLLRPLQAFPLPDSNRLSWDDHAKEEMLTYQN
jgi:hypothetical protein